MPVAVGLHHRHELGALGLQHADVVADRVEVDLDPRGTAAALTRPPGSGSRPRARVARRRRRASPRPTTGRRGSRRGRGRTRRRTPHPPVEPAREQPADHPGQHVARPGGGEDRSARGVDPHHTVGRRHERAAALQQRHGVASARPGRGRARGGRRRALAADTPERRANSPTCGVRIASALRSAISAARPANAFSPSASRTSGTGQSRTSSPNQIGGLLMRREARTDRERVGTVRAARGAGRGRDVATVPAAVSGKRQERRLRQTRLHDRQDALRDRDRDEARADPARGRRDQAGGAGHAPRAGDDHEHARRALVRVDLARRADVAATSSGSVRNAVGHDQVRRGTRCPRPGRRPRSSAPGSSTTPTLAAPNVTVRSARTASPSTAPVAPFTPEGMSTATTGDGDRVQPVDRLGPVVLGDPAEPRPEDRVDRDVGARELAVEHARDRTRARGSTRPRRAGRALVAAGLPEIVERFDERRRSIRTPQRARCRAATSPSPPLFPFPHTTTARRPYDAAARRRRRRAPPRGRRAPSRRRRRCPRSCVAAVERRRLLGREDGLHPATATANATAFVFSWVNVISTSVMPEHVGRRFALPSRRDRRRAARVPA